MGAPVPPVFDAAKISWNGTTWTVSDDEFWEYPLDITEVSESYLNRTWSGELDKYTRWGPKRVLTFSWSGVGTTVRDYVRNWLAYDGVISFDSSIGSWTCHSDDAEYSCTQPSYGVFNLTARLVEI